MNKGAVNEFHNISRRPLLSPKIGTLLKKFITDMQFSPSPNTMNVDSSTYEPPVGYGLEEVGLAVSLGQVRQLPHGLEVGVLHLAPQQPGLGPHQRQAQQQNRGHLVHVTLPSLQ